MPTTNHKKYETSRLLRVTYTDRERLELGKQLGDEHGELARVQSDLDRVKTEFKSKVTAHESKIADLSNKVSTGFRIEEVTCIWHMDTPVQGKKELHRKDTNEVVESADMTSADLQSELQLPLAVPAGTPETTTADDDDPLNPEGDEENDKFDDDPEPKKAKEKGKD